MFDDRKRFDVRGRLQETGREGRERVVVGMRRQAVESERRRLFVLRSVDSPRTAATDVAPLTIPCSVKLVVAGHFSLLN